MRGTHKDRAANRLEEQDNSRHRAQILGSSVGLSDDDRNLETRTICETSKDLIPDPFARAGANVQRIQKSSGNSGNGCSADGNRRSDASRRDRRAGDNGGQSNPQNQRQVPHTRLGGTLIIDRLEVDRQIIHQHEVTPREEEDIQRSDPDGTVFEQTGGDHRPLAVEILPDTKDDEDEDPADGQADDCGGVPGVGLAAVLKGEDVSDHAAHDQAAAYEIHLENLLAERGDDGLSLLGRVEEEQDDGGGDTADGQVDVETPPPRDMVGESATNERTNHRGDTIGTADDTGEERSLRGRSGKADDGVAAGSDASRTNASDGTTDDERGGVGRHTADQRAELEDKDGDEEG